MDIVEQLFSFSNLVFCLVIWVLVWIQRGLIEKYIWKNAVNSKNYKEFWVPLGPLGTGALLAGLIKNYPFPEIFADSLWGRIFFGIVCGLASAHVYRIVKQMLKKKNESVGGTEDKKEYGSISPLSGSLPASSEDDK